MPEHLPRRHFLLLLLAGAATGVAGCMAPAEPLRVASHVWPGYEFMFLARAQGDLPAERIRFIEMPAVTDSLQALAAGLVDGAALTLDEVLRARAAGVALSIVLVFDESAGADMLLVRPEIKQLGELKGKCIGVERSSVGALMLDSALKTAGLTPTDVRILNLRPDQQETAWLMRQCDALISHEPVASRLQVLGAQRLFDSSALPGIILDVLAFRSVVLEHQADAVRQLVAAHFSALERWRAQPAAVNPLLAQRLHVAADAVPAQFAGMRLTDPAANRRLLSGNPPPLAQTADHLARLMRSADLLGGNDALNDIVRADFLPSP